MEVETIEAKTEVKVEVEHHHHHHHHPLLEDMMKMTGKTMKIMAQTTREVHMLEVHVRTFTTSTISNVGHV